MNKGNKKWLVIQERGGDIPLAPPMFVLFLTFTSKGMRKILGDYDSDILIVMSKNGGKFATTEDQWNNFCDVCYKKILNNRKFLHIMKKEFDKRAPKFIKLCLKIYRDDLSKLSKKDLWKYYNNYTKSYADLFPYGEPIAFGSRYQLEENLSKYLKNVLAERKMVDKFDDYFKILTMPKDIPFTTREEIELLKISLKVRKRKKYKQLFGNSISVIFKKINEHPDLSKLLTAHEENFSWVPYNYGSIVWDKKDFIERIKKEITGDPEKKLKSLINYYGQLPQKQKKIYKKLKINKKYIELFEALQTNGYLIDRKKEIYTKSHFLVNKSLISEIGKRLDLTFNETTSLVPIEIRRALLKNIIPSKKFLNERWDHVAILMSRGKYKIYQGVNAEKFLNKIKFNTNEEEKDKTENIKGAVAMPGKVQGTVKVLMSAKEAEKITEGDVLVTFMTTPDFIIGMRKAGAIITNEGGITCHAAIVSRELGIPCIISTKNATKVLKDGDLVEVDANKGIIKILKRK